VTEADSEDIESPPERQPETVEGEAVPLNEVREVAQEAVQHFLEIHAGPLPSADTFASYEQTHPGTAAWILRTTEKEQTERHHLQRVSLYSSIGIRVLGMVSAVAVFIVALLVGADLIRDGKDIAGLVFLVGGLAPIIAAFLFRRHLPQLPQPPRGTGNENSDSRQPSTEDV
jgi:uncharacterized membrane protein